MRALHLLTVAALLAVSPAALAAPTPKDRAEAKARAAEGRKRMKDKRWVEAIVALKKAEKLDPSPALAVDVAQAQIGAGKLVEASKTLASVADGADAAPSARKARAAAKQLLADLKARIPTVTVKVSGVPAAKVTALVDGIEVEGSEDIPVNPGDHTISATADGFVNADKDVHFDEGAHPRVALELARIAARPVAEVKKPSGSRVPGAVLTTIGGLGLAVGGIFGGLAFSATSSAKSQCVGDACPPSAADDISRSKTFGNVSTGLFIGGGAVAVTGIVLLIAAPGGGPSKSDEAAATKGAHLTGLAPWVGPGSAGLGATGSF